jgi:U3 small nucleolar RNA-associated protein 15
MSDGTFSIRRRNPKASETSAQKARQDALLKQSYEFFLDAGSSNIGQGYVKPKGKKGKAVGDAEELRIESRKRKKLKDYDRLLKEFKYSAALDAVLKGVRPTC